ncbi:hypothetical protein [Pseudomonas sp. nanlin1]|uniref:hypothetical protein n=1 Tax=Pseudomonas sp. nanlin1 TaxID=3040605 RepID=UPI0038901C9C
MNWTAGWKKVAIGMLGGLMLQGCQPVGNTADDRPGVIMITRNGDSATSCEFDLVTSVARIPGSCVPSTHRTYWVQIANSHSATTLRFEEMNDYGKCENTVWAMTWKTIKQPTNARGMSVLGAFDNVGANEVIAPGVMLTGKSSITPRGRAFHCIYITRSDVPGDADLKLEDYPVQTARRVNPRAPGDGARQDIPEMPDNPEQREHGALLIRNRDGSPNCTITMKTGTYNLKNISGCSNDDAYGFMMQRGWSATTLTFFDTPSCAPTGDQNFIIEIKTIKQRTSVLNFYDFNEFYNVQNGHVAVAGILLVWKFRRGTDPIQGKLSCVKIERSEVPPDAHLPKP